MLILFTFFFKQMLKMPDVNGLQSICVEIEGSVENILVSNATCNLILDKEVDVPSKPTLISQQQLIQEYLTLYKINP